MHNAKQPKVSNPEIKMKLKTNHTCGNSQMVASHLTRGLSQQGTSSLCGNSYCLPHFGQHLPATDQQVYNYQPNNDKQKEL
jgi:hypothetical protein